MAALMQSARPVFATAALAMIASSWNAPALGAPLTVGNILVTHASTLIEYTPSGAFVQSASVPYGGGARPGTELVRDIIHDRDRDVAVYDGTFAPFVATFAADAGMWAHHTADGWSTVNNVSYGGIGAFGDFVFVTDMATAGAGAPRGIVRFDIDGYAWQRFAETADFIDLTVGLNNLLYALESNETVLRVFEPASMSPAGSITLARSVRGVAVNGSGQIFGASWDGNIYQFGASGAVQNTLPSGTSNLTDLDLHPAGRIVVGSRFGQVILTDESLSGATNFSAGSQPTFVAFVLPGCGDFDSDGDVDLSDFTLLQLCFGGSNTPPAPTCPQSVNADCDGDGDVDLADFLIFQQNFTGSR